MKDKVIKILQQVPDPELGISIWDLGLIYKIKVNGSRVEILMTLTTPFCPLSEEIQNEIETAVKKLKGIKKVIVNLTFEPPWTIEKMTKKGQKQLGFC